MRKKTWEQFILFGKYFEFNTKETLGYSYEKHFNIYDAYARPSQTKVEIYTEWSRWFYENNGCCWVESYNCNFFTIAGYVRDYETEKMYYCYITASHNRCWEVE